MGHHVSDRVVPVEVAGFGEQVDDDLGIAGGIEDGPVFLVRVAALAPVERQGSN